MTEPTPGPRERRVRALLVTTDYPPTRGGIQTMAREIVARAARTSFRVVAPADPGWRAADEGSRVPVRRVRRVAPGRRGFVPGLAVAALRELRGSRPDVVVALHPLAAAGVLATRVPLVVVTHGGELRSPRIRAVARRALARADRVVANSAFTRSAAVALGGDPMRISVIPVGAPEPVKVDVQTVEALRRRLGEGRLVLTVARLEPHKGHDRLLRALPGTPGDVRMVFVGRGSAHDSLASLARELGVSDRVVFAGEVGDDELPAYYAAADCFALASTETTGARAGAEGGGIALLEAAAYGLPLVAARTGGIPETVRDGETGLLFDPDDAGSVSRALNQVLGDEALARRIGDAASAMAAGERSWDAFVQRFETVVERAARRDAEAGR